MSHDRLVAGKSECGCAQSQQEPGNQRISSYYCERSGIVVHSESYVRKWNLVLPILKHF